MRALQMDGPREDVRGGEGVRKEDALAQARMFASILDKIIRDYSELKCVEMSAILDEKEWEQLKESIDVAIGSISGMRDDLQRMIVAIAEEGAQ